jgi:ubiquinone/menaquinone biosynthesis C-methylase UbiE
VLDAGCGGGGMPLSLAEHARQVVGIDPINRFAHAGVVLARERRLANLAFALADGKALPFADGTFDKAWSLDVLEHLSPEALDGMLAEAARVLKPGGALFVYTHVRKNARIAIGLRWINRFAQWLDRRGIVDLRQEHLRKSDHLNPLRDIPHLEAVADAAGFRIGRIRYYTPIVGGFVENILVRAAEKALARRARARAEGAEEAEGAEGADAAAVREARAAAKERIAARGPTYLALRAVSFVMTLDLLLFGRIRSGPFFALLIRK